MVELSNIYPVLTTPLLLWNIYHYITLLLSFLLMVINIPIFPRPAKIDQNFRAIKRQILQLLISNTENQSVLW